MRAKVGKDRPQVVCADRNLNHRETKKRKVTSHQHNVADEILQVIDMVDTHELVQEIVHTKQHVPSMFLVCSRTLWKLYGKALI